MVNFNLSSHCFAVTVVVSLFDSRSYLNLWGVSEMHCSDVI